MTRRAGVTRRAEKATSCCSAAKSNSGAVVLGRPLDARLFMAEGCFISLFGRVPQNRFVSKQFSPVKHILKYSSNLIPAVRYHFR